MAYVRFIADHDYRPSDRPRVTIAYKKGMSISVKRECATDAIAKGRAVELGVPPRAPEAAHGVRDYEQAPPAEVDDAAKPRARRARVRNDQGR